MEADQKCGKEDRREDRRDERRSAILKMAHQAFLAEGYAATSMSEIAARCGGSKATLYNYFPSKDGLFRAVVQDVCGEKSEIFAQELNGEGDFLTRLRNFALRFTAMVLTDLHVATYRMIIAASERFPDGGQAFYDSGPRHGAEMLAEHLQRAISGGILKGGDDPWWMARAFLHLCLADLQQRRLFNVGAEPTAAEIAANVDRALRMFMATYGQG